MSLQTFNEIKTILSLYLVPDIVNLILEMIEREYIIEGSIIHQHFIKKLNEEYKITWIIRDFPYSHINSGEKIFYHYVPSIYKKHNNFIRNVNDRPIHWTNLYSECNESIINFNRNEIVGKLPSN